MEDFYQIPENELRNTARFLRKEMVAHGWGEATVIRGEKNILIFATRPDGKKLRFNSCFPETTSAFSSILAKDKLACYELLKREGIPQPETIYLQKNGDGLQARLADLLEKYGKIVIKPIDGAHGRDIVTNISDISEAMAIVANSEEGMIAQEQLPDDLAEVRAICIDGKFIEAFKRIPATITGDGEHNVLDLIDVENRELRTEAYRGELSRIDKGAAKDYLIKRGLDLSLVLAKGEKLRVMDICNIGMGGTVEKAEFAPEQIVLVEKVARVVGLPVLGADFYGDKLIEVNAAPSLYYPTGDESADKCVKAYVNYLENL